MSAFFYGVDVSVPTVCPSIEGRVNRTRSGLWAQARAGNGKAASAWTRPSMRRRARSKQNKSRIGRYAV